MTRRKLRAKEAMRADAELRARCRHPHAPHRRHEPIGITYNRTAPRSTLLRYQAQCGLCLQHLIAYDNLETRTTSPTQPIWRATRYVIEELPY